MIAAVLTHKTGLLDQRAVDAGQVPFFEVILHTRVLATDLSFCHFTLKGVGK